MDFKKIPIIGEIDFSDPDKRKSSIRICAAAAMVVFVLIAIVVRKGMDDRMEAERLAAQQQSYESLDIPLGKSNETLQGKTMTDISKNRGTEGGFAKDFFSEDLLSEDPLAALSGSDKKSRGDEDPLNNAEVDMRPDFMKRQDDHAEKKDVYDTSKPSSSQKPAETKPASRKSKPGEAASRAIKGERVESNSSGNGSEAKSLEEMTYEERRRYLYLQNGLDPNTGEPLPGGPLDPAVAFREAVTPGSSSGSKSGGSTSSSSGSSGKKKGSGGSSKKSSGNTSSVASTEASSQNVDPKPEGEQPPIETARVQVRRSGGVSAFGMSGSSAGTSLSTLGEADPFVSEDPTHPFKVKFAYNEKVSSGQRVTVRLCEDMVVDGILIPENTHLFAICTVGDRMELKISSININGKMYTLNYVAYDNDGARGLYCPQTDASKALQQAGDAAGQIAQQAVQSAITGYPGRILNAGTQIINSKKGKTTVSVTAGYSFYIMQDDN